MTQTNSNVAFPDSNNGFILETVVEAAVTNAVSSAAVTPPGGTSAVLAEQSDKQQFKYKKKYDSLTKLNKGAPNGNYPFVITTAHDGTKTPSVSIQGDAYPQTPHLLNFDAIQSIDAGGYFVFRWEYMQDGITPDFVQLKIQDSNGNKIFETADSGSDAFNGSYASLMLLRNTLLPNQSYQGTLLSRKGASSDITSYPGAVGTADYYKRVSFTVKTASAASAADVKTYSVLKTQLFEQTDASTPVAVSNNGYLFQAQLEASETNSVGSGTLILPQGVSTNLNTSDNKRFEFEAKLDSLQQLDDSYPDGNYIFRIATKNQRLQTPAISLTSDAYPPIPQFQNAAAALAIDPEQDFVLAWQPFVGGTPQDFIHVQIEDQTGAKVMESADFAKAAALSGFRTSQKVQSGTLRPGTSYTAKLLFVRIATLETATYPGALGIAGFARETHLRIQTLGSPPTGPTLTVALPVSNQGFKLVVSGSPGLSYRIETSSTFHDWGSIGSVTLSSAQAEWTDITSTPAGNRFYRAVQQ